MKNKNYLLALWALSLFLAPAIFSGCGGESSSETTEEVKPGPPREVNWVTKPDLASKKDETLIFQGYILRVSETKEKELWATFGPRHNSTLFGGEIQAKLSGHPLVKGYQSKSHFTTPRLGDSTEVISWEIYMTNGDTITDKFVERSRVWVKGKVEREPDPNSSWMPLQMSIDSLYAIPADLEAGYQKAVPLTPELGKYKENQEEKYTYSYLDGIIEFPKSVTKNMSYSFHFKADEGFYNIMFLPVHVGQEECGKTAKLFDGYSKSSVVFWDANLKPFESMGKVRVYGLWEEKFRSFTIEEFVVLQDKPELGKTRI